MGEFCGGVVPWDTVFRVLITLLVVGLVLAVGFVIVDKTREAARSCGANCTALTTIPLEAKP